MATVRSLYPPRCHDRQCPYNVWLYCSGPFPSQLEVQYWNVMYKSKLKGERAIWRDKPELLDPLPLPKKWKIPKLYCISGFKSSLRRSSSNSSLSTSYTDIRLPIDPYSPHAFTVNMNEQSKTKTQQDIHQVRYKYRFPAKHELLTRAHQFCFLAANLCLPQLHHYQCCLSHHCPHLPLTGHVCYDLWYGS